ncbi:hypothetical protein BKA57DRAFT_447876 [Linnemannia elongata]|nr:hypothetical protein BKA57DRAFT_447876 [Linnemannia elongata]
MPMRVYFPFLLFVYLFTCSGDSACLFTFLSVFVLRACVCSGWWMDFQWRVFLFFLGEEREKKGSREKEKARVE